MSHFPPRSLLLHSSRLSLSLSFFLSFQVVISGALCTVEDYVIMSQCAHNKAIHLAAEGTVSVTDISQIRKYPINFHTNPNKTEKKKHLNNNRVRNKPDFRGLKCPSCYISLSIALSPPPFLPCFVYRHVCRKYSITSYYIV